MIYGVVGLSNDSHLVSALKSIFSAVPWISSRNSIPISASPTNPFVVVSAPVKVPFLCPKSKDSVRLPVTSTSLANQNTSHVVSFRKAFDLVRRPDLSIDTYALSLFLSVTASIHTSVLRDNMNMTDQAKVLMRGIAKLYERMHQPRQYS
jgi:hypothetical protein